LDKYRDVLELNEYFQPVYDLTNEVSGYWKQFIPNDRYHEVLRNVLASLESNKADEKKSFWLQGNYGTGKSHATAVIKHLLYDDYSEIKPFVENFDNTQLQSRLLNFRKKKKVFPVVLKGLSNVTDNRTFSLVIERAVKKALKKNKISISTKSDFEKMLHHIENNPMHIDWDYVISQYPQISMYVKDKKALIKKLKSNDLETLHVLESLASKIGTFFTYGTIDSWLIDVAEEIKSKKIADYLMIYWDEFTSVLQHPNSGMLLTELQHVAELSVNKGVHIFAVTHKTLQQTEIRLAKEEIEKALGRFIFLDYSMETLTTYHIIGAATHKKDREEWERARDKKDKDMDNLIRRIIGADSSTRDFNLLKNLFPIHPYTAYLCTFIVRNIGSTERSIFNFLYDEKKGFSRFIKENPSANGGKYLTADYLWDFFMAEFERVDFQRFSPILDKYKLYGEKTKNQNSAFYAVFKGVLLLNAQYKMVNISEAKDMLVSPSFDNIKSMFWGTEYQDMIAPALDYLDTAQILSKNPDNLYLVASSSLPLKEIEKEKTKLFSNINQITDIFSARQRSEIEDMFTRGILRENEFHIFDASIAAHSIKSKLSKVFKKDYALHFVMLIACETSEKEQCRKSVQKILEERGFENIVFIILEELFNAKTYDQYLEYRARVGIADRHNFQDEKQTNMDFAVKTLDRWIHGINSAEMEYYLGTKKPTLSNNKKWNNGKLLVSMFPELVNTGLSEKVFYHGMEVIKKTKGNQNVWKREVSKVCAENFLFANTLEDLQSRTPAAPNKETREIVKNELGEYIVDQKLEFRKNADDQHPLLQMSRKIEDEIENQKKLGTFNLGSLLLFLNKPPFGLYPNKLHMSAMGFLLRKYVGKLYESGKGKPVEKEAMRDKIIALFKVWESGKDDPNLRVRLGTVEEKELIQLLQNIFDLKNIESLSDVKWKIREWIKKAQFPLWVFKLATKSDHITNSIDDLTELIESMDENIDQDRIQHILSSVGTVKTDLKLTLKQKKSQHLFNSWLKSIENIAISDEEMDTVIEYVRRNMPEEIGVYSWKEDNVREKVKDWYIAQKETDNVDISKGKNEFHQDNTRKFDDYDLTSQNTSNGQVAEPKIKLIISEIKSFSGDWAKVLSQMINEHPEIGITLKEYMDSYND